MIRPAKRVLLAAVLLGAWATLAAAQTAPVPAQTPATPPAKPSAAAPAATPGLTPPADYVIGPDDVLAVAFWREKDMSADVVVRPDGKITLPLINDIQAAGLTPAQLRDKVQEAAGRYIEDTSVSVIVKQINSRRVYITGSVNKPGTYPLTSPTTVLQLLAMAGGLGEFSKGEKIVVMRTDGGKTSTFKFNYKDVLQGRNLQQNIELRPGDTVMVP